LTLGRAKDAETEFRKALEVEPKLALARTKLASALLAQGRAAEAEDEAKKASDADQKSAEAFAVLGKAIVAKDANRWNDAIAQAQQGAFLNARDAAVQVMVGEIFEVNGNIDQAQQSYGRALAADPGYLPARLAMVQVQIRKGQFDAALNDLQKIAQETNSGPAYLQLGRIFLRKGDWPGAASALEKAVALLPGSAEAHARLGTALTYTGKRPEALAEYKKAVELEPANTDFRTTYGLLLGIANQDAAGVAELQKVIATPGYKLPDAYINLGWIYRNMEPKKAQESVAAYKKALELDPKQEQAALGMGWAYTYMKDWDNAIGAFQKAIEIDPTTGPEANSGIAWSYFFKKDLDKAEEYLKKGTAAGRTDAKLAKNIEIVRKGGAAEGGPDLPKAPPPTPRVERPDAGTLSEQLMGARDVGTRVRAARELAKYGTEGVSALINAVTKDADWGVLTEAARSLGSLGPKASTALPHLNAILHSPPRIDTTVMTKEQMAESLKEQDFRRAVRDAVLKIQGK
jgi:tetratricopeptide (TPR) repeat protein